MSNKNCELICRCYSRTRSLNRTLAASMKNSYSSNAKWERMKAWQRSRDFGCHATVFLWPMRSTAWLRKITRLSLGHQSSAAFHLSACRLRQILRQTSHFLCTHDFLYTKPPSYVQQDVTILDLFTIVPRGMCKEWDWGTRFPYVPSVVAQQMPVWPIGAKPSLSPGSCIINTPTAAWWFSVGCKAMVDGAVFCKQNRRWEFLPGTASIGLQTFG